MKLCLSMGRFIFQIYIYQKVMVQKDVKISLVTYIFIMQKKSTHLKVATLNFSGINVSPFEYHDGSKQKDAINRCFKKLLDEYQKKNPDSKWNIAKIDKVIQRERYTILYRHNAGVIRGRLLNKNQYQIVWDAFFEQNQNLVNHLTPSEESINLLRTFDWMMYEAFVTTLYGKVNWGNLQEYNVQRYLEQLKKWHQKKYLKWQPKINYVKNFIIRQNIDILFLQQAGHEKIEASIPENYMSFRTGEAMIVIKKCLVVQDPQVSRFHLAYGSKLNFNHDSHYVKLKNYLLCCSHLSSKSGNIKQAEEMANIFYQIRNKYQDLDIIAGVDANHYLRDFPYFNVYPSNEQFVTTRKKRTSMQLQFQKSQKLIEQAKDHLISNLILQDMKVQTVGCEEVTNDLLPNQEHPYDHFMVYAKVRISNKIQNIDNPSQAEDNLDLRYNKQKNSISKISGEEIIGRSRQVTEPFLFSANRIETEKKSQNNIVGLIQRSDAKLRLSQNSCLHLQRPSISFIQSQNNERIIRHSAIKPEIINKSAVTQTQQPQVLNYQKHYNSQQKQKYEQHFLQFSKSPKMALGPRSKSKPKDGLLKDPSKGESTVKLDKSKELAPTNYKKY